MEYIWQIVEREGLNLEERYQFMSTINPTLDFIKEIDFYSFLIDSSDACISIKSQFDCILNYKNSVANCIDMCFSYKAQDVSYLKENVSLYQSCTEKVIGKINHLKKLVSMGMI